MLDEWNKWVAAKKAELESPAIVKRIEGLMRHRYPSWQPGGDSDVVETQMEVEEVFVFLGSFLPSFHQLHQPFLDQQHHP